MTIAVHTNFLGEEQATFYNSFIFECLTRLTLNNPQHQFVLLSNKPFAVKLKFSNNVTLVLKGPASLNLLVNQYWFNYTIPRILKKHKADVFVSMDGICGMRISIPQCLFLSSLDYLENPSSHKKSHVRFYKKNIDAFLSKATVVATVFEHTKMLMQEEFKIPSKKINVVYCGTEEKRNSFSFEEKLIVKEQWAEGKEYFLYKAPISAKNNIINLLKAFSFFKKRQKSNMMLLMIGHLDKKDATFIKALKTFKFKAEVKILDNLTKDEIISITNSAMCLINPITTIDMGTTELEAMNSYLPVICTKSPILEEICGPAALYINPQSFEDIADKMMLVYKDEDGMKKMVAEGQQQLNRFNWDKTADLLWKSIQQATK